MRALTAIIVLAACRDSKPAPPVTVEGSAASTSSAPAETASRASTPNAPSDGGADVSDAGAVASTSIRFGKPFVNGPLDGAAAVGVLRAHVAELRACYANGLASDPSTEGTMQITFDLEKTGKVIEVVRSAGSLYNETVEKCVLTAVPQWTFPTAADMSHVVDTIVFSQ